MFRDVASIVAEKAINPDNNRPYTVRFTYYKAIDLYNIIYIYM